MDNGETREWRGAVCVGVLTSRWPFGKLIISSERIQLKSLLGNFVLARDEVESIRPGKALPWLWMGIRIHHTHDKYPKRLMFSPLLSWRRNRVLNQLESLGYNVA